MLWIKILGIIILLLLCNFTQRYRLAIEVSGEDEDLEISVSYASGMRVYGSLISGIGL